MKRKTTIKYGILLLTLLLNACRAPTPLRQPTNRIGTEQCSAHPFLEKYGCSIIDLEQNAENGDADAAYALGYVYYYGIGTSADHESAELWIKRAANQKQPLALAALAMIEEKKHNINAVNEHNAHPKTKISKITRTQFIQHPKPIVIKHPNAHKGKHKVIGQTSGYTIQLMASKNRSVIKHILLAHPKEPLQILQSIDNGQTWNILIYGYFKKYSAAQKAVISMKQSLKKQKPWIRQLKSIHQQTTFNTNRKPEFNETKQNKE